MATKRGRRKSNDESHQKTVITNFFKSSTSVAQREQDVKHILSDIISLCSLSADEIVGDIIEDVLCTVNKNIEKKPAHSGDRVSKKTLSEWTTKYPWLIIKGESNEMKLFCRVCMAKKEKLKLSSVWATDGCPNIQNSSIGRHNISTEHENAYKCSEKEVNEKEILQAEADKFECDSTESSCISPEDKKLFKTVYFAAKTELPSATVNGLLSLQFINGVDIKYKNLSWDTVTEIQSSICHVLKDELVNEIKVSKYFGLMLDESTDLTVEKRLSICIRYVKAGEPVTKFLCNVPVDDGCAHTIMNCVADTLDQLGIPLHLCTSLATDGAAAMMGKRSGVGVQLQSKYSPFCTQTHCVAHRLNLACTDTIKKSEYMIKFRDKFNSLYFFMNASSLRTLALKKIQEILDEPEVTIKQPHSIRWLGLKNAVEAVFKSYSAVLATLSKFAAEKNSVAKGLHKYFKSYKVALVTAFMLDVHCELAVLSCQLQKQNLLFSEICPLVDGTLAKLDSLKSVDGESLIEMKQNISVENEEAVLNGEKMFYSKSMDKEFETLRSDYLKKMKKNIKERFKKKDMDIFDDLSKVLEPEIVNNVDRTESEEAVNCLGTFYGYEKKVKLIEGNLIDGTVEHETIIEPLLDPKKLEQEWLRLNGMIRGAYAALTPHKLCKRILLLHKDLLPNFAILASIALCMQLTSVECERSFSAQNRLKNKYRSSLGSEAVDSLMTIIMLGPSLESFEPNPAITHWLRKNRRKGRLFAEYKPRAKKQKLF